MSTASDAQYAPVLLAGFSCGMGLMSMVAIAFALIKQSLTQLRDER